MFCQIWWKNVINIISKMTTTIFIYLYFYVFPNRKKIRNLAYCVNIIVTYQDSLTVDVSPIIMSVWLKYFCPFLRIFLSYRVIYCVLVNDLFKCIGCSFECSSKSDLNRHVTNNNCSSSSEIYIPTTSNEELATNDSKILTGQTDVTSKTTEI